MAIELLWQPTSGSLRIGRARRLTFDTRADCCHHRRQLWLFNSGQLSEVYDKHAQELGISPKDQRKLIIFFSDSTGKGSLLQATFHQKLLLVIEAIAKADDKQQPRQDVIGTAILYFRRFYKVYAAIHRPISPTVNRFVLL